jgi:hypothetical protein
LPVKQQGKHLTLREAGSLDIRLLIVEPDEEVLDSHLAFFRRATKFSLESAKEFNDWKHKYVLFVPHVMLLEPAFPEGPEILDQVEVPVVVLSRLSNDQKLRTHPSVSEYYVKPQSLAEIGKSIERLATSSR